MEYASFVLTHANTYTFAYVEAMKKVGRLHGRRSEAAMATFVDARQCLQDYFLAA